MAAENVLHACLGFDWLGLCNYDPAKPTLVYFDLGAAIGALAFTLAVQQLLKPIHRFRLAARHLTLVRVYICVFSGVAAVIVAAVMPNITSLHGSPWGYPINWEILATLLFALPYGAVVIAIVRPVRVKEAKLPDFAQQAALLLSSANEQDHIDFASDLERSLPNLIEEASFLDTLPPKTSAFFDFIHRDHVYRAAYAASFLRIIADPSFCETLVKRLPWRVVFMLREISQHFLFADSATQFIRELSRQAILRDDSMMEREIGYHGFGAAPLLSDAMFSDLFVLERYNPFDFATHREVVTPQLLKRFNSAAERCYTVLIESGHIYYCQATFRIQSFYRGVFFKAWELQKSKQGDTFLTLEMGYSVDLAIKMADKLQASLEMTRYQKLYVDDPKAHRSDVLETLVEIVYEALCAVSNQFKGFDDAFWIMVIEVAHKAFPPFGSQPVGMTPFQQRLALKLIEKLKDNMKGYYPAICRILLAWVGPYAHQVAQPNRTAFNILKDAVYFELQSLPQLAAKKPEKIRHYLPDNVKYDSVTTDLVHTYRSGTPAVTRISALKLSPTSLLANNVRGTHAIQLTIVSALRAYVQRVRLARKKRKTGT
jgi:hypothetical protein